MSRLEEIQKISERLQAVRAMLRAASARPARHEVRHAGKEGTLHRGLRSMSTAAVLARNQQNIQRCVEMMSRRGRCRDCGGGLKPHNGVGSFACAQHAEAHPVVSMLNRIWC